MLVSELPLWSFKYWHCDHCQLEFLRAKMGHIWMRGWRWEGYPDWIWLRTQRHTVVSVSPSIFWDCGAHGGPDYFYYLFQERNYLSESPARVKNNVLCWTQMQDMRTPGEVGRVLRLPFSRRHLSSVIISDTNDKHLYFIWTHSCMLAPSQNSFPLRCLTVTFKNCVRPVFLRASVSIYSRSAWVRNVSCVGKLVGCGDPCRTLL